MAVFRVERNRGYTVMSNHHLHNKELVPKGKVAAVINAFTSRRLGLYPCWPVPYQQGEPWSSGGVGMVGGTSSGPPQPAATPT